jgi:hypothetical protein
VRTGVRETARDGENCFEKSQILNSSHINSSHKIKQGLQVIQNDARWTRRPARPSHEVTVGLARFRL